MKRQDLLLMLSTFAMGLVIGFYVFLAGFAPTAERVTTTIDAVVTHITITGEAYGGCQRAVNCPSFNIAADGTYRFFSTPRGAAAPVLREGTLPLRLQQDIDQVMNDASLRPQALPIEPLFCESFVDGIDVRYRITINEDIYDLDSCGTDVVADSLVWVSLGNIWDYFEQNQ